MTAKPRARRDRARRWPRSSRRPERAAPESGARTGGPGECVAATKIDNADDAAVGRRRRPARAPRAGPRLSGGHGDAEHVAEHRDADLHSDPGQKPDQHRARQEIGQEAGLEDAREQKQRRRLQRQHADQRHVAVARRAAPCGKRAGEDRSGRRIGRDHQMARRAEDGESDEGQENGVKAGDDRRAGDAGVAEHLRNVHRGERHAGEGVAQRLARLIGRRPPRTLIRAAPLRAASPTVGVNSPFPVRPS